jgi:deoxyribonuclease-4
VEWAAENGFGCMQIFASSPGAWKPPVVDLECAHDFALARQQCGVTPLVIHAIYLINMASADPVLVKRSRSSLKSTLQAGAALGAASVVTHIGSHGGRGFAEVREQVAEGLREVLEASPAAVELLLENSAGPGGIIGARLDELGSLIEGCGRPERLKVAIDTAHLCAAGWDFTDERTAPRLVAELEEEIGLDRLALVHANDSAQPVGRRKDRHANIGDGYIGLDGFRHLLAQPALRRVPWILETPNLEQRVEDVAKLRALSVGTIPTGALGGT